MLDRPLYPIGVVAELLEVHPETIRVWEKSGVTQPPQRRSGKRYYSDNDLARLRFIKSLIGEGLNLPAIRHFLRLYPCWEMDDCPGCMHRVSYVECGRPCWKESGTYCHKSGDEDACANCPLRGQHGEAEIPTPSCAE